MLVLTRRKGESVEIGNDIRIVVIDVAPNGQVKLGFEADAGIIINRSEIAERIRRGVPKP